MRQSTFSGPLLVALIAGSLAIGCASKNISDDTRFVERTEESEANEPRATYKLVEPPLDFVPYHPANKGGGGGGGGGGSGGGGGVGPVGPSASGKRLLYLNANGGIYRRGWDDSGTNTSSILETATVKIPAYADGSASWSKLKTCVAQQYERWNVVVTDVDPGNTPHIEAVIGGRPSLLGLGSNVGGVAPMTKNGATIEEAVVYVFSDVINGADKECEVTAHELGHAIGLEHVYLCEDPMTYLQGCGKKSFQDTAAWCGESAPRECRNGGKQNSVQFLSARLGLAKPNNGDKDDPKPPPKKPPTIDPPDDDDDDEVVPPPPPPPKKPPPPPPPKVDPTDDDDDGEVVPPAKPPPPPVKPQEPPKEPPKDEGDDDLRGA